MKFPNIAQSILYAYTNVLSLCKSPVLTNTKFSIIRQLFKLVVLNLHNFGILKANEIKYAITIAVMVDLIVIHCLDRNGWQIAK